VEVILVEDVAHLGAIGTLVKVAPGFGRNYLLPKKLAILASTKNKARLEHEKRIANFRRAKTDAAAEGVRTRLESLQLRISRKVGEQDKLFGSVTAHDVEEALKRAGITVDRRKVDLAEPIKALGEFNVPIRLSSTVKSSVKLTVVAEA
jgi:large subunit ribosomal protein L9